MSTPERDALRAEANTAAAQSVCQNPAVLLRVRQ